MAVLTFSARLFDIFMLRLGSALNRFFVRDLGLSDVSFHVELSLHAVHHNFKLKFAHTRNNRLAGFTVRFLFKRWVFVGQTLESKTHFFLVSFGLWLNAKRYHRLGKFNRV